MVNLSPTESSFGGLRQSAGWRGEPKLKNRSVWRSAGTGSKPTFQNAGEN